MGKKASRGPEADSAEAGAASGGLLKSTGVYSAMTMASRVLGLVRDIAVAHVFGAGVGADAFFVAFKVPNFFRRLFAEGAFSQAFVPVLSEYRQQRSGVEVKRLVDHVAAKLGLVLLLVSVLAVLGAPALIRVFAPGFVEDPAKLALATEMLRLTFPYLFFISLSAFAGAILQSYGRFAVPAVTPVLLNLTLIASALWLAGYWRQPAMALAWGVLAAGLVQLLFNLPFLARLGLMPRPRLGRGHEGVRRILKLMAPALFGVSITQINLLIDTILASFLETGSVSWLYFSDRLMELPLGVFGIAIGVVILPKLSRQHADASPEAFAQTLDWALRAMLIIALPATLALGVLAEPLLATLFQYGAFTGDDVTMAAQSLRAYALGLLGFMLIKILSPGYFARQDTRTPVRIAAVAMGVNIVLNLALVGPLAHAGLALATSLGAFVNAGLLFRGLARHGIYRRQPGWLRFAGQLAAANAAMVAFLIWSAPSAGQWLSWTLGPRALTLTGVVVGGAGLYFAVLALSGVRLRHFAGH